MRTALPWSRIARVKPVEAPIRVVMNLETGASTISGSLQATGFGHRRFWGWLELLAALEALRQVSSSDVDGSSAP